MRTREKGWRINLPFTLILKIRRVYQLGTVFQISGAIWGVNSFTTNLDLWTRKIFSSIDLVTLLVINNSTLKGAMPKESVKRACWITRTIVMKQFIQVNIKPLMIETLFYLCWVDNKRRFLYCLLLDVCIHRKVLFIHNSCKGQVSWTNDLLLFH